MLGYTGRTHGLAFEYVRVAKDRKDAVKFDDKMKANLARLGSMRAWGALQLKDSHDPA